MFINGSNVVWIKNKKEEIGQISLKDLARHKSREEIFIFNGTNWDKVEKIEKVEKQENVEIILKNGTFINISKTDFEKRNFKENDIIPYKISTPYKNKEIPYISELIPWFLGYYVANGSYSEDIIQIATNKNKKFVLDNISKLCEQYNERCYVFDGKEGNSRLINMSSKLFSAFIDEYISGYTCYGKHFSNKCFNTNKTFLENILQGYLDGDAHYEEKNDRYIGNFTRKNYELAKDLRILSNILGKSIKMSKSHASFDNRKFPIWTFKITKRISEDNYKIKQINFKTIRINLFDLKLKNSDTIFLCGGEIL